MTYVITERALMLKILPVLMFAPLTAFIQPQIQTTLKITTSFY